MKILNCRGLCGAPVGLALFLAAAFSAQAQLPVPKFNYPGLSIGGNQLTVTTTSAIFQWKSFNIGAGQSFTFKVPTPGSAVLNEVVGMGGVIPMSIIDGQLNSFVSRSGIRGGSIYLLDPSGILVGPSGSINVGSFIGTALSVQSDNDWASYVSGKSASLTLGGGGNGSISVQQGGAIQAGDVFLIAHNIDNEGAITGAHVGLGAGSTVELQAAGDQRISVLVDVDNSGSTTPLIQNGGTIKAAVAELDAAGGNMYALAINNGGAIRATTIVNEGGKIYLRGNHGAVVNSGTLDASAGAPGKVGGTVQVTGDDVELASGSTVNVSGPAGGGTALIGGGAHGADPNVPNALETLVEPGAVIDASATEAGNGGKVVVWSDNYTGYAGTINAAGGPLAGNGGFAEVSGGNLGFTGTANLTAPNGALGTLLLDPQDLTIAAGSSSGSIPTGFSNPADTGTVTVGDQVIGTALVSGDVTLYANDTITLNSGADVDGSAGTGSLTMLSGREINFVGNDTITLGAGATFSATINAAGATAADRNIGGATFIMDNTSIITAPGGITISTGTLAANSGGPTSVYINTDGGSITLGQLAADQTSTISINAANAVALDGNITAGTVSVHSDNTGAEAASYTGDKTLTFGTGVTVSADNQTYQAGIGDGTLAASIADLVDNSPQFVGFAGTTAPQMFELRQDASLNDTTLGEPAIAQFPNGLENATVGTVYTLESDGGGINATLPANFANTQLTLTADGASSSITLGSGGGGGTFNVQSLNVNSVSPNYAAVVLNDAVNVGTGTAVFSAVGAITGGGLLTAADIQFDNNGNIGTGAGSSALQTAAGQIDLDQTGNFHDWIANTIGALTLDGAAGASGLGNLNLTSSGDININLNLTASTIDVQAATSGTGTLTFDPGTTVQANTMTFRAGSGSGTTANVNFANATLDATGSVTAPPASFTYEQDAAISDSEPAVAQFGNGSAVPATYALISDGGGITLTSGNAAAANLNASALTLTAGAGQSISIGDALTLTSLNATAPTIDIAANGSVNTSATSGAGQTYTGTLTDSGAGVLTTAAGSTLNFDGAGPVGTSGAHILTAAGAISFGQTGNAGGGFVDDSAAFTLSGAATGALTLTASGLVTIDGNLNFSDTGSTLTIINSSGLVSGTGSSTGSILLGSSGTLDLAGAAGTVGTSGTSLSTDAGTINFTGNESGASGNFISDTASSGTVTLEGAAGGSVTLATASGSSLTTSGTFTDTGKTVTLDNAGSVAGGATISVGSTGTLTLDGTGAVGASSSSALNTDAGNVDIASGATPSAIFLNDNLAGTATVTGTGKGAITLVTASGTTLAFSSFSDTGKTVTLDNAGSVASGNTITLGSAGTLDLDGTGAVGSSGGGNALSTDAGTISYGPASAAAASFVNDTAASGTVTLNGTADGNVTVTTTSPATLAIPSVGGFADNGTAGTTITLNTGALTLSGALNAPNSTVTFNNSGAVTGSGLVTAAAIDLNGTGGNFGTSVTAASVDTPSIVFGGGGENGGSGNFISDSVGVSLTGTAAGNVTLTATGNTITIGGANFTAGSSALALNSAALTLTGTLTGGTVTLNNTAAVTGAGTISATTALDLNGSGSIPATLTFTTPSIVFGGSGEAGGATLSDTASSGAVNLSGTAAGNVTLNTAAGATLTVPAGGFIDSGSGDTVSLTANSGSGAITVSGILNAANNAVALNGGALTLSAAVDGTTVTLDNSGTASGAGAVNATTALDLNGSGSIPATLSVNTPSIVFGGSGEAGGATLSDTASSGAVNLSGTADGVVTLKTAAGATLTVPAGGFSDSASGDLVSLNANSGAGAITVNGALNAANDPVTLTGGAIGLNAAVDGTTVTLVNSGTVSGSGSLNATTALDLNGTGAIGTSAIAEVNTSAGAISFGGTEAGNSFINDTLVGAVTLSGAAGGNVTLATASGGTLGFSSFTDTGKTVTLDNAGSVNGGNTISVGSGGTLTLGGTGAVGASGGGNALSTDAGTITYNAPGAASPSFVNDTLGSAVSLSGAANGAVTVTTASTLTIPAGGFSDSGNPVSLTANAGSGNINLNGTLTAGNATLDGAAIALTAATAVNAGSVTLDNSGAVTGTGAITTTGGTLILEGTGQVGTGGSPTSTDAGTLTISSGASAAAIFLSDTSSGTITLGGTATGPVTLATTSGASTLDFNSFSDPAGTVTLKNTGSVAGGQTISVGSTGTIDLNGTGAVGASAVSALNTDAGTISYGPASAAAASFVNDTESSGTVNLSGTAKGNVTLTTASGSALSVGNPFTDTGSVVTLINGGTVTGGAGHTISVGSSGTLALAGAGSVGSSGNLLATDAGTITFTGTENGGSGNFINDTGATVALGGAAATGALTLNTAAGSSLSVAAGGFSDTAAVTLNFSSGSIAGNANTLTASSLTLNGSGNVGTSSSTPLTTDTGTLTLGSPTAPANAWITDTASTVSLGGAVANNGAIVFSDATANAALTISSALSAPGASGSITLNMTDTGSSIDLANNLMATSGSVTLNNNGSVTGSAAIMTPTLNLDGTGSLGALPSSPVNLNNTGSIVYNGSSPAELGGAYLSDAVATTINLTGQVGGSLTLSGPSATHITADHNFLDASGSELSLAAGGATAQIFLGLTAHEHLLNLNDLTLDAGSGGSITINDDVHTVTASFTPNTPTENGTVTIVGALTLHSPPALDAQENAAAIDFDYTTPPSGPTVLFNSAPSVDIYGTTDGGDLSLTENPGSGGNITINNSPLVNIGALTLSAPGSITIGKDVSATSINLQAGTSGTGNLVLLFTGSPTITAATQSYQAGSGSGNSASISFSGATFEGPGPSQITSFTYRQDAGIADSEPTAAQFTGGIPQTYLIESDGGGITLSAAGAAANLAGSALTLTAANGTVAISADLTSASLASLMVNTPTFNLSGPGVTATGAATLNIGTASLTGPLNAGTVTFNNSGAVTGGGLVSAATVNLDGSGNVGTSPTPLNLDAGTIAFGGSDEGGAANFVSDSASSISLTGAAASALTLTTTDAGGTLNVGNGGAFSDTGNTVTFINSGSVVSANPLALGSGGTVAFNGTGSIGTSASSEFTTDAGAIAFGGTEAGGSFINDTGAAVDLSGAAGGAVTLNTSGALTIDGASGFTDAGKIVTFNNSGSLASGAGAANGLISLGSGGTLTLGGTGAVGSSGNSLLTDAGTIAYNTPSAASASFVSDTAAAVALTGAADGSVTLTTAGGSALSIGGSGFSDPGNTVTLDFGGSISGGNSSSVLTAGTIDFSGAGNVGTSGATPLFTSAGAINLSGSPANVWISQDSAKAVTLTGSAVTALDLVAGAISLGGPVGATTVTFDNSGAISGSGLLTATTLKLDGSGNTTINNANVGALVLATTGGSSTLNNGANAISLSGAPAATTGLTVTAGTTTIGGALNTGSAPVTLNTTTLALNNTLTGGTVTLNNSGAVTGSASVNATTLDLNGTGTIGTSAISEMNTSVGAINFGGTEAGGSFINDTLAGTVTLGGTAATGALTLNTAAGSTLGVAGGNFTDTASVTLNDSGSIAGGGGTLSTSALTVNGSGNVGTSSSTPLNTDTPSITLSGSPANAWINNGANAVSIGGAVGNNGALDLIAAATTLSSPLDAPGASGAITLNTTSLALGADTITATTVTLNNSGAVSGSGAIAATTLNLDGSGSATLTTSAPTLAFASPGEGGGANITATAPSVDLIGISTGALTINAQAVTIDNTGFTDSGALTLNNSGAVTGGTLTVGGLTLSGAGDFGSSGTPMNTVISGALVVNTANAFINNNSASFGLSGSQGASGVLTLTTTGAITLSGPLTSGTVTLDNAGAITGSGLLTATTLTLNGAGGLGATGAGNAVNTSLQTLVFAQPSGAGSSFINNSSTTLDLHGTSTGDLTLTADNVSIDPAGITDTGKIITFVNSGAVTGTGLVSVGSGGTLGLDGTGTAGSSASSPLTTDAGTVSFKQASVAGASFIKDTDNGGVAVNGTAKGGVSLDVSGPVDLASGGSFSAAAGLTVTAASISQSAGLNVGGSLNLTATTGSITLGNVGLVVSGPATLTALNGNINLDSGTFSGSLNIGQTGTGNIGAQSVTLGGAATPLVLDGGVVNANTVQVDNNVQNSATETLNIIATSFSLGDGASGLFSFNGASSLAGLALGPILEALRPVLPEVVIPVAPEVGGEPPSNPTPPPGVTVRASDVRYKAATYRRNPLISGMTVY